MATDMAGREIATVLVDDDVAVEKSTYSTGRRGVAGTLVVERLVGAAAEQGGNLAQLRDLGERVVRQTRSMGVALTSCTVPAVGTPTFSLGEDEMEMGVGIHGEPGRRRMKLAQADAIAEEMLSAIVGDLDARPGSRVLLLVNGLGGTPAMELYVLVDAARRILADRRLAVARHLVGPLVTSLDMAGCSITLTVVDDRLLSLWDEPLHTAALRWRM
jgi:dihydroxyacetone kinase-like protein